MNEIAKVAGTIGVAPSKMPCTLAVTAVMPIPLSWSKKKRQAALEGHVRHTVKPDWDNIGKVVSDALNGVTWVDDSQVYWANVKKIYGPIPRLDVTINFDEA